MRYAAIFVLAALGLSITPKAMASNFGCESVAGSVIFKDTFYGVLTGSLLSGLYILSQDDEHKTKNNGQIVAQGAAVGGALGVGLGVLEVALRECPPAKWGDQPGLTTSFAAVPTPDGNLGAGWRVSWKF